MGLIASGKCNTTGSPTECNVNVLYFNVMFSLSPPGGSNVQWKEGLQQKATEAFLRQQQAAPNLRTLVYGAGIIKTLYTKH